MIDPDMTLVIKTKKVGPWIHMNLCGGALNCNRWPHRQLEALGYFAEGSASEPGEEVIPEPATDEVVMFE
jgi:hypothetical protein